MGYRSNKNQFRPRPPKGPVKLAFGLVEPKGAEQEKLSPPKPPEPLPRQEIVGTLYVKKVNIEEVNPIPTAYLQRILKNLNRVYQEGKFLNARSVVDFQNGELIVSFSYDQLAIDHIKGLDRTERAWDPDLKAWRVFPGCFDDVFDILGKGIKLTDEAFSALQEFVHSKYYAHIARSKMGKLIVRESWYEELDLSLDMPEVVAASGSSSVVKAAGAAEAHLPLTAEQQRARALVEKYQFVRKPYSHQKVGMEYLLLNKEAALLDEMGCGKSFQIASALGILFENKEIDRALIVCPMSLTKTWQLELGLASREPLTIIAGSPSQRAKQLAKTTRILVIHYEGLRLEEEKLADWLKQGCAVLVFDESQRIKNLEAQTTQAALRLRPFAGRCIIATGTPIANRPLDLFAQYLVMDRGKTFGVKFPAFKNTFCELDIQKIQVGRRTIRVEKFIGVRNSEELRRRIHATSLRRLKSEVLDLPPVIFKDFIVELKGDQKTLYNRVRDNLRVEIQGMSAEDLQKQSANIIVKLLRLSQIASNPNLLDVDYEGPNAKLTELDCLLEDVFSDDSKKVILWSHYVQNINLLCERYAEKFGAVGHTGEMSIEDRQKSVSLFQEDSKCRLFVATPQSAKEGLTLLPKDGKTKADTMIYLDLSFDSGSYVQSQARFHRIGQTAERCLVVHLIGESTVDEYIRKMVAEKLKTATELLDDVTSVKLEQFNLQSRLNKDEILQIL